MGMPCLGKKSSVGNKSEKATEPHGVGSKRSLTFCECRCRFKAIRSLSAKSDRIRGVFLGTFLGLGCWFVPESPLEGLAGEGALGRRPFAASVLFNLAMPLCLLSTSWKEMVSRGVGS